MRLGEQVHGQDALKYHGKHSNGLPSFLINFCSFNYLVIVAEASLYLERENVRSQQLDLELRHHAFVRHESCYLKASVHIRVNFF